MLCESMNKKMNLNVCLDDNISINTGIYVSNSRIMIMGISECESEWNYELEYDVWICVGIRLIVNLRDRIIVSTKCKFVWEFKYKWVYEFIN